MNYEEINMYLNGRLPNYMLDKETVRRLSLEVYEYDQMIYNLLHFKTYKLEIYGSEIP